MKKLKKRSPKELWYTIRHIKDSDTLYSYILESLSLLLGEIEASIFIWESSDTILKSQKIIRSKVLQDGDETILLNKNSPLWSFSTGTNDLYTDKERQSTICYALRTEGEFLGMIRITLLKKKKFSLENLRNINNLCADLSIAIQNIHLFMQNEKHVRQLRASFEITANIVQSLHLEKLLKLIANSIITHLGFDRVRLYIIDQKERLLRGKISRDIRGSLISLENEYYPLKSGIHPLVDHTLGKTETSIHENFRDIIDFVPLKIKNIVVGLLVIDNIISQQKITPDETTTIHSFAGQIAMAVENARLFEKIEELSITDSLTELLVKRHFKQKLKEEVYRSKRYKTNLAIFLIDVDNFKPINDTHGHPFGDIVLKSIADSIKNVLRQSDFACRYGGDEFMICKLSIKEENAVQIGQRLLESVLNTKPVPESGSLNLSISIGIALFPENSDNIEEVIKKADEALYYAKENGKGQICGYWQIKNK